MCSPGTFLVANYLIINNGSCQVNFTKPKRDTIRYTNSQWPHEDATEVLVGRVAVPKTVQKTPLPRENAIEAPVGRVAVPKVQLEHYEVAGLGPIGWPFATLGCL